MIENNRKLLYKIPGFIVAFLILIYLIYCCCIQISVYFSAKNLNEHNSQEYLRIKLYGNSYSEEGSTVSGTFSIIDYSGNEIAVIERSWSGSYIAVEFNQAKIAGKYYVFPTYIYGKNRIFEDRKNSRLGTSLEKYYNENNKCMLWGNTINSKNKRKLYKVARYTAKKYFIPTFKIISSYSVDLSNCRNDVYYSISYDKNGRFVVSEI